MEVDLTVVALDDLDLPSLGAEDSCKRLAQPRFEIVADGSATRFGERFDLSIALLAPGDLERIVCACEAELGAVQRQVDVLGEPLDQPEGLRQRRASLEEQRPTELQREEVM